MSHINTPNEYYSEYDKKFTNTKMDEIHILSDENIQYVPNLPIELNQWKIFKDDNLKYHDNHIKINNSNDNWEVLSYYQSNMYGLITLEHKTMIDNILASLKKWFKLSVLYSDSLNLENIYIISILNKLKFNISKYDVIRIIFKDKNLVSIEMTVLSYDNNVIDVLYNQNAKNETSFSDDSSILPTKPIYTLEYTFDRDDLGIVLSSSDKLNIYDGVSLLTSIVSTSDINKLIVKTKDQVSIEIYMIKDGKFLMVKKDISNVDICLDFIDGIKFIKKNILIKLISFNSQNVLYLSKIYL